MVIKKFEEIISWQKSQDLSMEVYSTFRDPKDYGFKDQICRSSVSISSNIAEGFDRSSDADFKRFLFIALGSTSETKSMLYLAEKLNYITTAKKEILVTRCDEISRLIHGLKNSLRSKH